MAQLRIATRRSALAMWQAEHVAARLRAVHPGLVVDIVPMSTRGDEILDTPLSMVGGKGLFTHELENAMVDGRADLAVHSLKDMPAELPEGMVLAAIMDRADPHDALVSNAHDTVSAMPAGTRVGTSSMRRKAQLAHAFPHLEFVPLRGNVNTRLAKLDAGELDAIILAAAGLMRLGLDGRIRELISKAISLPAIGQGVLAIECPAEATSTIELLSALDHAATRACAEAERAVNRHLGGDCHAPIAAYAHIEQSELRLRARVGSADGRILLEATGSSVTDDAVGLGIRIAEDLVRQGARALLDAASETP